MTVLFLCLVVLQLTVFGNSQIVRGIVPCVFTPFTDNGEVNYDVIPAYAQYLQKNNISGVLVAGTASEGPTLSLAERKALLDAWMKAARPIGLKVVMQVGGLPLPEVIELTRYCEKVRPDVVLALPELYYRPTDAAALVQYMKLIAEAAPTLPVMYYDHPSISNVNGKCFERNYRAEIKHLIPLGDERSTVLVNMAKFFPLATKTIPNFKGIKCGFAAANEISSVFDVHPDQRVFMAGYIDLAGANLMGYSSTMTAVSNVFPKMVIDIERAIVADRDIAKARYLQLELNRRVAQLIDSGPYVPTLKACTEIVSGVKMGSTRQPLLAKISQEQKVIFQEKLRKMTMLNLMNCTLDSPCNT